MFSLKARADRLRKVMELIKADACIVKSEQSRRYLTGIDTAEGVVVITRVGNRYFLACKSGVKYINNTHNRNTGYNHHPKVINNGQRVGRFCFFIAAGVIIIAGETGVVILIII